MSQQVKETLSTKRNHAKATAADDFSYRRDGKVQ
jgi:hypothetical protein